MTRSGEERKKRERVRRVGEIVCLVCQSNSVIRSYSVLTLSSKQICVVKVPLTCKIFIAEKGSVLPGREASWHS